MTANLILAAQARLGEGALWDGQRQCLFWVDIEGCALHAFDPATGHDRVWATPSRISTVVPYTATEVLVALQTGLHTLNLATGALTFLVNPIASPTLRYNDGKCDPAGRFWVGTLDLEQKPGAANLYCYDTDGSIRVVLDRITNSNGLAWSADARTMYYIDTPTQTVQAFAYDQATGRIANGRVLVQVPVADGFPDGMTLDADGNLWVALWGGGRVNCYHAATGELLHTVAVPAPNTSSCAFGGPGLKTLFITTAREGLNAAAVAEYPLSGNLFAVQPGVAGVLAEAYRGG